ncbi:MAG: hypothetical protein Q9168_001882 [Polycauliona sp. 1 TL-2023]
MLLQQSERISIPRAQQLLSEFLKASANDPSLHPNALLTENGPVVASSGSTGLVLHNLKRVEAGLRDEHLAADLTFTNYGGEGLPALVGDQAPNAGSVESEETHPAADQVYAQGWQDKAEYEREQAVEQGEVGPRGDALEHPILNSRPDTGGGAIPVVENAGASMLDKDERKRKKKEKRDQKKKLAEAQRQKDVKAEKDE